MIPRQHSPFATAAATLRAKSGVVHGLGRVAAEVDDLVAERLDGLLDEGFRGEAAVVESLPGGVIPSALVRTEGGRTRRVRTIDLEKISAQA